MSTNNAMLDSLGDGLDIGLSAYGGINPIFGNIYAGYKNAKATKEKENTIHDYGANLESIYNKNYNQNFLDTNLATSVLTKAYEEMKNANNLVDKQAATTGATNEATLAAKTKNTEQANKLISNVAAMGTARQDQAEGRYMSQQPYLMQLKTGVLNDKIEAAQTQAANSNETMKSMLSLATTASTGVPVGAFTPPSNQAVSVASNQVIADDLDTIPMPNNTGQQLAIDQSVNPYNYNFQR